METVSRISSMLETGNHTLTSQFLTVYQLTEDFNVRTARELTLEAAQSAASTRGTPPNYSSTGYNAPHIKKLLDSRNEREVLDGMRRVISVRATPCVWRREDRC